MIPGITVYFTDIYVSTFALYLYLHIMFWKTATVTFFSNDFLPTWIWEKMSRGAHIAVVSVTSLKKGRQQQVSDHIVQNICVW